jgi:hypothetical protein
VAPPAGDGEGALPGFRHVGHTGEQTAQLDGGRQFASLVEGGTDCGGFCLGDNEHAGRMGTRSTVHAQRIYEDMNKLWFMPAPPVVERWDHSRPADLKSSGSRSAQITARDPFCPEFIEGAWEHLWAEY